MITIIFLALSLVCHPKDTITIIILSKPNLLGWTLSHSFFSASQIILGHLVSFVFMFIWLEQPAREVIWIDILEFPIE